MMKIFAIIVLIIGISSAQDSETDKAFRAELDKKHKECFEVSKLDPQVIEKARMGDIDESNTQLLDHVMCLSKKYGILKDNEVQPNAIKQYLEKQNRGHFYEDIVNKCKSIFHDDFRVLVIKNVKCSYQHAPEGTIIL